MKRTLESLKEQYGSCFFEGKEYILTEYADFMSDLPRYSELGCDNYYDARVIYPEDEIDEYGYQPCYKMRWEILDDYDPYNDGERDACDWDSPSKVSEYGEYSVETGRYY